jgi:adenine phosphoribosyltransferase
MDWLKEVKEDLRKAKVVKIRQGRNFYDYIVNPLSSGVPEIPSQALWGCAYEMARILDLEGADKIMVPEAMGFHIGAAMSMVTGLPLLMIRKRPYFLKGEVGITKKTGYEVSRMYINGVRKGDRVVLVDSIIATGGTLISIIQALKQMGVKIQDVAAVVERKGLNGVREIKEETGVRVKTLLSVEIVEGKVTVR